MTVFNYSTVVNVCEDTNEDFDVAALLAQVGYTANGALTIDTLLVADGQGGYVPAPTLLFSQVDDDTVRVSAAAIPNYFGSFDTLSVIVDVGADRINLTLKVIIDSVNDAPSGTDSVVALTSAGAYVLSEANFGFTDVDGNAFKSVLISALPATGQMLLNGVAISPGTEVLASDIRAGRLTYLPAQGTTGIVGLSFQVRDDGGTVGCNATDLDPTCNILTFKLPVLASLGDRVWLDGNGNGLQDSGEAGFAGVTVRLLNGSNQVVATTTTDATGQYLFTGLLPGQYKVQVVSPNGYQFTTANAGANDALDSDVVWNGTGTNTGTSGLVTLAAGETNRTLDAGVKVCLVKVGDTVWWDANANGVQDAGERGIAGVAVKLTGAGADGAFGTADDVVRNTTTDASGKYLFDGVAWGQYKLSLGGLPAGYGLTAADVGTNDALDSDFRAITTTSTVNLITNGSFELLSGTQPTGWVGLGDTIETNTAASYGVTGATGARVVELDANRTYSNNTGLGQDVQTVAGQSYTLSLDVAARSGTLASTNTVEVWWNGVRIACIEPTSTALKTYSFTVTGTGGLDRLALREQAGDDDCVGGIIDNVRLIGTTSSTVYEAGFAVVSCNDNLTLDAGLVLTHPASLGDRVWFDANGNGLQDSTEAGAAGVTVRLLNPAGQVLGTTTTDATGAYLFTGLPPGQYAVQVVAPQGQEFTLANAGSNDGIDSDVLWSGTGNTATSALVTLAAGENNRSLDAGLKPCLVDVGDRVWLDANGNGLQDAGEAGVAGVAVKLIGAGHDGQFGTGDDTVRSTTTDAAGNYRFTDAAWGSYKVAIGLPTGYQLTAADVGNNDALDSDFRALNVAAGPNLIVNGSFEQSSTGWCGLGDSIEVQAAYNFGVNGATGSFVAELDANRTWTYGTGLYQDVQTAAGQSYTLSVDLAARAGYASWTNTVEVWWNGTRLAQIDPTSTTLSTYSFNVTGTGGTDRLSFREQHGDDDSVGGIIDNVRLMATPSVAYESAAFTLADCNDNLTIDAGLTQQACVTLVGADCIYEGSSASYALQLDRALAVDTTVFVSIVNGSAQMVTGPQSNQVITAGGGYTEVNGQFFANQYFDPVYGTRYNTATGPAAQNWDFSVRDLAGNWVPASTAGFAVTIRAGQTTSAAFNVDAWKEKVYADLDFVGSNYKEAAWESFQLQLSGGNAFTEFCEPTKTVSIGDTSTYYTYSPIVLDLDGNGIQTTALIDAGGSFDLFGTGQAVQSGWISGGDAFLAVDLDGNGRIDDIGELFGGAERGVGFAKLASFDSNGDGVVDSADARFAELKVWQDANGNHATDAGELRMLAEAGIASLNTAYLDQSIDQLGNLLGEAGTATRLDGSAVEMVDVYFNVYADDAAAAQAAALPALDNLLFADDALLDRAFAGGCSGGADASGLATAGCGDDSAALMRQVIAAMKNADLSAIAAVA